jgi:D-glycero-alpha-D-manno-heptose 1-phosphate guanylyltransferase
MEAIILAGGFGTRLSTIVKDVPKPMAPINNKPFLQYILDYCVQQGVARVILSVGYKKEIIQEYFRSRYKSLTIDYCEELEPLGTGGAIKKALSMTHESNVFIVNGDSMFSIDYNKFYHDHQNAGTSLSIALRYVSDTSRYGAVRTNDKNIITEFLEKKTGQNGTINGGVYCISNTFFNSLNLPDKFSFEKDVMERYVSKIDIAAFCYEGYFIDIGVPEDFHKAQKDLVIQ